MGKHYSLIERANRGIADRLFRCLYFPVWTQMRTSWVLEVTIGMRGQDVMVLPATSPRLTARS